MGEATHFVAAALGAILVMAGLAKLADVGGFERKLTAYALAPHVVNRALARIVPLAEIAVGGLLVAGVLLDWAAGAAAALFATFAVAISAVAATGRRIPCACFGDAGVTDWATASRAAAACAVAAVVAATVRSDADSTLAGDAQSQLALATAAVGIVLV